MPEGLVSDKSSPRRSGGSLQRSQRTVPNKRLEGPFGCSPHKISGLSLQGLAAQEKLLGSKRAGAGGQVCDAPEYM